VVKKLEMSWGVNEKPGIAMPALRILRLQWAAFGIGPFAVPAAMNLISRASDARGQA
jgi:hypothetical protein